LRDPRKNNYDNKDFSKTEIPSLRETIKQKEGNLEMLRRRAETLKELEERELSILDEELKGVKTRLKMLFGFQEEKVVNTEKEIEEISKLIEKTREEVNILERELPKILEVYYEKIETFPLSNKEKRELLKPEALAEISTEEYIALWRKLNPHFLTHITRQGFRDHVVWSSHSLGFKDFHNGFEEILKLDKSLFPPIAVEGLISRDKETIKKFLENQGVMQAKNEEEAKKKLSDKLNFHMAVAPKYADKTAVHFGAQIVENGHYGGEEDNEIFFVFPSDVLASQYKFNFNGEKKDFGSLQHETGWNDVFVWPSDLNNPGILLDAGIVFLPENTLVDSETGSRYHSEKKIIDGEETRTMIKDEKLINAFCDWAAELNEKSPVVEAYKEYKKSSHSNWKEIQRNFLIILEKDLGEIGFCKEAIASIEDSIARNGHNVFEKTGELYGIKYANFREAMEKLLMDNYSHCPGFKLAEKPIRAKEYWENYFSKNPKLKPKHIVYYNGDPTEAVKDFQKENNFNKQADASEKEGKLLGFDDNHVYLNEAQNIDLKNPKNPDSLTNLNKKLGYDELVKTAHEIIKEHYEEK